LTAAHGYTKIHHEAREEHEVLFFVFFVIPAKLVLGPTGERHLCVGFGTNLRYRSYGAKKIRVIRFLFV